MGEDRGTQDMGEGLKIDERGTEALAHEVEEAFDKRKCHFELSTGKIACRDQLAAEKGWKVTREPAYVTCLHCKSIVERVLQRSACQHLTVDVSRAWVGGVTNNLLMAPCKTCGAAIQLSTCDPCRGEGKVLLLDDPAPGWITRSQTPCPECNGLGYHFLGRRIDQETAKIYEL